MRPRSLGIAPMVLLWCSLATDVANAQKATLDILCESGNVFFSDLRYTPCGELAYQVVRKKCVLAGSCPLESESESCAKYMAKHPELIYQCSRKPTPSNGIREAGVFGGFQSTIPMCSGDTDIVKRAVIAHRNGPRNRRNEYRIPSEEDKIAVRGLIRSIRLQEWNNVMEYSRRVGAKACRLEINGDDILAIEPTQGRLYNAVVIYFRLNAPKQLLLEAAHANLEGSDSGTLEQSARLFQKSKIMAVLIPGYARWSSAQRDWCQPSRFITDNSHSTENLFFHAQVGFRESFGESRHIQLHRMQPKLDMWISQGINGRVNSTGFLNSFAKSLNETSPFSFSTLRAFAASLGSVLQTKEAGFGNVTPGGRLLNGAPRPCQDSPRFNNERFLHIEQSGKSIMSTTLWVKALNKVMETEVFKHAQVFNEDEIAKASDPSPSPPALPPLPDSSCDEDKTFYRGKCVSCESEIQRFLKSKRPTSFRRRLDRECKVTCPSSRYAVLNFRCVSCDATLAAYRDAPLNSTLREDTMILLQRIRAKDVCTEIPLRRGDCGLNAFDTINLKCLQCGCTV